MKKQTKWNQYQLTRRTEQDGVQTSQTRWMLDWEVAEANSNWSERSGGTIQWELISK